MKTAKKISLNRQERATIAISLDFTLMEFARLYSASCDAGSPNRALLSEHGRLMRLRDKVLTGRNDAQQDAAAQRVADASEHLMAGA